MVNVIHLLNFQDQVVQTLETLIMKIVILVYQRLLQHQHHKVLQQIPQQFQLHLRLVPILIFVSILCYHLCQDIVGTIP
jgi:hypothetical protein